jgi:hypothetical protein
MIFIGEIFSLYILIIAAIETAIVLCLIVSYFNLTGINFTLTGLRTDFILSVHPYFTGYALGGQYTSKLGFDNLYVQKPRPIPDRRYEAFLSKYERLEREIFLAQNPRDFTKSIINMAKMYDMHVLERQFPHNMSLLHWWQNFKEPKLHRDGNINMYLRRMEDHVGFDSFGNRRGFEYRIEKLNEFEMTLSMSPQLRVINNEYHRARLAAYFKDTGDYVYDVFSWWRILTGEPARSKFWAKNFPMDHLVLDKKWEELYNIRIPRMTQVEVLQARYYNNHDTRILDNINNDKNGFYEDPKIMEFINILMSNPKFAKKMNTLFFRPIYENEEDDYDFYYPPDVVGPGARVEDAMMYEWAAFTELDYWKSDSQLPLAPMTMSEFSTIFKPVDIVNFGVPNERLAKIFPVQELEGDGEVVFGVTKQPFHIPGKLDYTKVEMLVPPPWELRYNPLIGSTYKWRWKITKPDHPVWKYKPMLQDHGRDLNLEAQADIAGSVLHNEFNVLYLLTVSSLIIVHVLLIPYILFHLYLSILWGIPQDLKKAHAWLLSNRIYEYLEVMANPRIPDPLRTIIINYIKVTLQPLLLKILGPSPNNKLEEFIRNTGTAANRRQLKHLGLIWSILTLEFLPHRKRRIAQDYFEKFKYNPEVLKYRRIDQRLFKGLADNDGWFAQMPHWQSWIERYGEIIDFTMAGKLFRKIQQAEFQNATKSCQNEGIGKFYKQTLEELENNIKEKDIQLKFHGNLDIDKKL